MGWKSPIKPRVADLPSHLIFLIFVWLSFRCFFFFFKNLSSFEQESDWRNLNALNC